jgi:hypothetical protein
LALAPLTLYVAGLGATVGVERFNDALGRRAAFFGGKPAGVFGRGVLGVW